MKAVLLPLPERSWTKGTALNLCVTVCHCMSSSFCSHLFVLVIVGAHCGLACGFRLGSLPFVREATGSPLRSLRHIGSRVHESPGSSLLVDFPLPPCRVVSAFSRLAVLQSCETLASVLAGRTGVV